MTRYRLPDGFTVTARGEADSPWNGFPVPILSPDEYHDLLVHLLVDAWDPRGDPEAYSAEYVDDGIVTAGYYCDGLQWEIVTTEEDRSLDT